MGAKTFAGFRFAAAGAAASLLLAVAPAPARSADAFPNGNAFASAVVAKVAPGVGGLGLATTSGVAVAEIKSDLAQSQAQTADLGLVGTSLTAEGCDGSPGTFTPDQLPQPTRVDNRKGDAEAASDEVPLGGSTLGGGREVVKATKQPMATASATTTALATDPLVKINAGHAEATTRIVDKKAREAVATVDVDLDLGGALQLSGLRWQALHRTGDKPDVHGAFSVEGASAGGVPLPVSLDQLAPLQAAINSALKFTGIRVELPTVTHIKQPADVIRVSPLRIIMQDTPLGATALRPVLDATRKQKEQLFIQLGSICKLAGALLVGDIGLSILAGSGFLAVDIGGVEATTAEVIYTSPFGIDLPLPNLPLPGLPDTLIDTLPYSQMVPDGVLAATERPTLNTGPIERVCESVHPYHWPSCSHGAAAPLGILGILVTAGVAFLDWRHQRRRAVAPTDIAA
jgi:hypothetical protein